MDIKIDEIINRYELGKAEKKRNFERRVIEIEKDARIEVARLEQEYKADLELAKTEFEKEMREMPL